MHRTAFGHARIDHCGDPATTPLDFQGRTGTFRIERHEAKMGISASPGGPSVTEMLYQHGFTSPSPWWRPTDAPRRGLSRPPPVVGGHARGEAVERWGRTATALRLPRWRRRSGLAVRCCAHREWLATSRQEYSPGADSRRGGRPPTEISSRRRRDSGHETDLCFNCG
jgi:hypothetical protein